ncbi:MAG: hypothetical protein ACYS0D_05105 [Planctomycetota bacterium]
MKSVSKRVRQTVGAAAALALVAGALLAGGSDGPNDGFLRLQMFLPTADVLKDAEELGFEPIALVTKHRFYDEEADAFDPDKYEAKIWTPDDDAYPDLGTWEKFGIPPAMPVWCDLDYEKWDEIFYPENFTHQQVQHRLQDYLNLIQTTRDLRPNAFVCMHGLVRGELSGPSGDLITEIVTRCDAQSPTLRSRFYEDLSNVNGQMAIKETRLVASLELKRDYGLPVLPLISKRYRLLDENGEPAVNEQGQWILLLTPVDILEQMMELILTTEVDGYRVDGVIVWANDNKVLRNGDDSYYAIPDTKTQREADASDRQFLRLIHDHLEEYWQEGE